MNREEARILAPIFVAYSKGETIQFQNSIGNWIDVPDFKPELKDIRYRIKPQSKKVKMNYNDFKDMPIIWTRDISAPDYHSMVTNINAHALNADCEYFNFDQISDNTEWSTDRINWNKFTKEINNE